jgi:hypothetical protein
MRRDPMHVAGRIRLAALIFFAVVLCVALTLSSTGCAERTSYDDSVAEDVRADIDEVMSDIDEAVASGSPVGLSSNPFHYVGISPAFQRLVDRGVPALEPIIREIESSPDNGLREYLLAIAGKRISGLDIGFDTGKGWAAAYRDAETND